MSDCYANIIVDIHAEALDRSFTYSVPEHLRNSVSIGTRVRIPFGKGDQTKEGYIVSFTEEPSYDKAKIKPIEGILTDTDTVEARMVALAAWMAKTYSTSFLKALSTVLPAKKKIAAKQVETIFLAVSTKEATDLLSEFERKHANARARTLRAVLEEPGIKRPVLQKTANVPASVVDALIQKDILQEKRADILRIAAEDAPVEERPSLTTAQMEALAAIRKEWAENGRPVLLHGETGSGKTLLYMDLIEEAILDGKDAIVLIPEIALTYQTVRRFSARFGRSVSFLNSRMSEGERYDLYKAARQEEVRIVIGPRSALFTPFPNLGLVVIDEEHEDTYRSEKSPRYDARETAEMLTKLHGAHLLLGSATPSIVSYYKGEQGIYKTVSLAERFGTAQRTVRIVDLRKELAEGNRSVLSRPLYEALDRTLSEGNQAMLFLNRRGYAGFVSCRSCGTVMRCPHCDVSLTEHAGGKLICHYCGYTIPSMKQCPTCGSTAIGGMKIGTQQVEQRIAEAFPGVSVVRMDRDTTAGKEGHKPILERFAKREARILIGTQMIVKGHDFPKVALIGILNADMSLNESDYRSAEKTYALLAQAVGRCARADVPGEAIIQTYHPDHYSVACAAKEDYVAFYTEEMAFRTLMDYPPRARLMAVCGTSTDEERLLSAMNHIRSFIDRIDKEGRLHALGPVYGAVRKVRDVFTQRIYLRSKQHEVLAMCAERIDRYVGANRGFEGVSIQYDYNV